jgi:uncharacterized protein YndB with AHSA1/START domain
LLEELRARKSSYFYCMELELELRHAGWCIRENEQGWRGRDITKQAGDEERLVVTRVFEAPREPVWKVWTEPEYVMQWWGPKGFTAPYCKMDFRVGGKSLCCMKAPDGQEFWNAVEYREIVLHEKIVSSMYFADAEGNKVEPAEYGIEHEAIEGAFDVTLFEDLGDGRTRLTYIGNEPMESAKESGQVEGWMEILEKVAEVVAGFVREK